MRYEITPDVLAAPLEEESVLLHMKSRRYFRLNSTGQRVWELLEAGRSRDEIVAALVHEYEVDADEAAAAVGDLLVGLARQDLVRGATDADCG